MRESPTHTLPCRKLVLFTARAVHMKIPEFIYESWELNKVRFVVKREARDKKEERLKNDKPLFFHRTS